MVVLNLFRPHRLYNLVRLWPVIFIFGDIHHQRIRYLTVHCAPCTANINHYFLDLIEILGRRGYFCLELKQSMQSLDLCTCQRAVQQNLAQHSNNAESHHVWLIRQSYLNMYEAASNIFSIYSSSRPNGWRLAYGSSLKMHCPVSYRLRTMAFPSQDQGYV